MALEGGRQDPVRCATMQISSHPESIRYDACMGRSRSMHHLFHFVLGPTVVAKTMHEIMKSVILFHSLDVGPVLQLNRSPYRTRIHHRGSPSRRREVSIRVSLHPILRRRLREDKVGSH